MRLMKRVESFTNVQKALNERSGPIATDICLLVLLEEIAGSLAVIADVLTEEKDGEQNGGD